MCKIYKIRHGDAQFQSFRILRKCQSKFDCLIFELLLIKTNSEQTVWLNSPLIICLDHFFNRISIVLLCRCCESPLKLCKYFYHLSYAFYYILPFKTILSIFTDSFNANCIYFTHKIRCFSCNRYHCYRISILQ